MSSEARRRAMRKWRQTRSEHAEVLSGLERAIAAHPAGGRAVMRRSEPKAVTRVPRERRSDSPGAA
jgi:ferric-dicitrate binding protein FerR (iron transport regulator)